MGKKPLFLFVFYIFSSFATGVYADSEIDANCLANVKQRFLNKDLALGDEEIVDDDWFVEAYQNFVSQKSKVIINSVALQGKTTSFSVNHMIKPGPALSYDLDMSQGQAILSIEFESQDRKKSLAKSFFVSKSCQFFYRDMNITVVKEAKERSLIVHKYHNKVGDFKLQNIEFQGQLLDFEKTILDLVASKGDHKIVGQIFNFNRVFPVEVHWARKSDGQVSVKFDYIGFFTMEGKGLIESEDSYSLRFSSPIEMHVQTLDLDSFMALKLQERQDSVSLEDLDDEFLFGLDSVLQVSTDYVHNLDFLNNYFELEPVSSNVYNLKISSMDVLSETDLMSDKVLPEDKPYLMASNFIELDHPKILEYVKSIRSQNLQTRAQVIQAVQKLVTEELEYDNEMVENDLTRLLYLDDFLSKGKGVCQHFALLSTTLLRALGIPARILGGYFLEGDTAIPHAWIEVKQSNKIWLPIEPQERESFEIWSLHYYPINLITPYEEGNSLGEDNSKAVEAGFRHFSFKKLQNQ